MLKAEFIAETFRRYSLFFIVCGGILSIDMIKYKLCCAIKEVLKAGGIFYEAC